MIPALTVRRPVGDDVPTATLYYGASCLETTSQIDTGTVHCVVTSPPYWGLREYEVAPNAWGGESDCDHQWVDARCSRCTAWLGQLGHEETPEEYIEHLVEIFREIHRVLRDDGTLWLNLGDSYARGRVGRYDGGRATEDPEHWKRPQSGKTAARSRPANLKEKDLVGIPWMAAFALRAAGWYLRTDIVWAKTNPQPENVRDRVTRSHEFLFLLTKSPSYFFDEIAIREPDSGRSSGNASRKTNHQPSIRSHFGTSIPWQSDGSGRNKRSVWPLSSAPYKGAHFATFPPDLVRPCLLAGTSARGCCPFCGKGWEREQDEFHQVCGCPDHDPIPCTVLDPFSGSGTTGMVALDLGRCYIGLDASVAYRDLAVARLLHESVEETPDGETETDGILDLLGVEGA
jgi:DNA modification methylase